MKKMIIGMMSAAVAGLGWGERVTVDGVAAHVNDAVVTVGEVKEAMAPALPQLRQIYEGAELAARMKELYNDVLEDLINAKLILKAYDSDTKINKDGFEKYVEKKISEFIQDRFEGDRQEFLKALRDEHLSMEEWRRRMRERIIVGMMRSREVDAQIVISPKDVLQVYNNNPEKYSREERVRIRVIVIHGSTNAVDRAVREASAKESLVKARTDADFGDLARKLSEDGKAASGGDWGWVDVRDLRPELAAPISKLGKNGISDVIVMDGDYYLVKVEDRQRAGAIPFEEVRTAIEKELRRKEARRLAAVWVERLRKDAYIQPVESASP